MADADSFSVHEVATLQLPLTTKPVRTSEDISYSGNSQRDDSNNIGNDEVSHSASRDFAETLKEIEVITYGHIKNQQTGPVVTGFDSSRFMQFCDKASPNYEPTYCNYDELASELFQVDEVWISRDLLLKAMEMLANYHGFTVCCEKESIKCNREGSDKSTRDYLNGPLKSGCTFHFKLSSLETEKYLPPSSDDQKKRWRYKNRWDRPIKIISGCAQHGTSCHPSRLNRVTTSQRARKYINDMPNSAIFALCNHMENSGKLSSDLIRRTMQPVWPRAKSISKHDVFNIRVKVMRLLPIYKGSHGDYSRFKDIVNATDFLNGIHNEVTLDDDEAYELAQSLWLEVESTTNCQEDGLFSFIEYLELINSKAKGFLYELARGSAGNPQSGKKKLLGVVWQTATMRRNFELFGDLIGLDMMKRGINTLLWPYFSVAMYNEMKKVCIACEGILCGEREDMYQFGCNFLAKSSPGRPFTEVNAVAADGFFDQDLIVKLGFVNAQFILDQWHLLDSGLMKMFGKSGYELLNGHLIKMIKAQSEIEYDTTLQAALHLLHQQIPRNGNLEHKLHDFASRRKTYASYLLAAIPGNRGLHGNACSEQNHWSVLSSLNPGVAKGGNMYCEHPIQLIRDLLKRQKEQTRQTNLMLEGMRQKMRVELGRLRNEPQTALVTDLVMAASTLGLPSYERYKLAAERAVRDLLCETHFDPVSNREYFVVRSHRYPDAPPRIFKSKDDRCNCIDRIKECDQCAHEILLRGGFDSTCFLERHFSRECVKGSLVGWLEASSDYIGDLIGCEDEAIHIETQCHVASPVCIGDVTNKETSQSNHNEFPLIGSGIKPLNRKQVSTILSAVAGGYSSFSQDQQFEISHLVLQLQELMTVDKSQSSIISDQNTGFLVDAPNALALSSQRKLRAKPSHEIHANKVAKKIKRSIQNMGLSQDIHDDSHVIIANGNPGKTFHCSFCTFGHMVTNCPRRAELKMNSYEYQLTTNSEKCLDSLRCRVMSQKCLTMIIPQDSDVFGMIPPHLQSKNFILHYVHDSGKGGNDIIDNRLYCVSFLMTNGEEDPDWSSKWIVGKIMNSLITHKHKAKKYVYDRTPFFVSLQVSQQDIDLHKSPQNVNMECARM